MPNLLVQASQGKRRPCLARCFLFHSVRLAEKRTNRRAIWKRAHLTSFIDLNVLDLQPGSSHLKLTGPTVLERHLCLLDATGDVGGVPMGAPMVKETCGFWLANVVCGINVNSMNDAGAWLSSVAISQAPSCVPGYCPNSSSVC